jgi:integrase
VRRHSGDGNHPNAERKAEAATEAAFDRHRLQKLADAGEASPAFGLCVTSKGARSFVIRYRRKSDGVERRMVIGRLGDWNVVQARIEAKRVRREVDLGADPLADIERTRSEPTLREVTERDWNEIQARLRPTTLRTLRNQLDRDILPELGNRKINSITDRDIAALHAKIVGRGSQIAANRTIRNLGAILSRSIERGGERVEPNPARGFKKMSKEQKRERYLSPAESARFRAALDGEADRQAANALKLIWLTGSRAGETLAAKWSDFDLLEARWTKPRHSTKGGQDHNIPLSAAAVTLLRAVHRHRDPSSPYLFPAIDRKGQATHRRRIDDARLRILKAAGITDLRAHDLRHDFATIVHDRGAPLAVVGRLLGHRDLRSTARYSHPTERGLRAAVEQAAEAITGTVVPLVKKL